jgi:hypothetical protein
MAVAGEGSALQVEISPVAPWFFIILLCPYVVIEIF